MIRGVYSSTSGFNLRELEQQVWANNLANIDTPGFKKDLVVQETSGFEKELFRFANGERVYLGKLTFGTASGIKQITDFSQGTIETTSNPLDLAIDGRGFFVVMTPQGEAYTRAGNFTLSPEGKLVTWEGYPVMGEQGEIVVGNSGRLEINERGEVQVDGNLVNRLRIVDFDDYSVLIKKGQNLFIVEDTDITPYSAQNFKIVQGALERANLDPVEAMVHMIEVLRKYESVQKTIQSHDEALQKATSEIARL
ncbi:flagellar basal-body rod protein FlgF [Atrimonas thermophila]|uniref:flagellar basal-body rod protein FlgF n=1 Tax=Atrimonas thermophila TaxID=3064161 RepID=UPI00399C7FF1